MQKTCHAGFFVYQSTEMYSAEKNIKTLDKIETISQEKDSHGIITPVSHKKWPF
jgi:hypothetical protein